MSGAGPTMVRCWGITDDGSAIAVVHPLGSAAELIDRWPPIGMRRVDEWSGPVERRLEVSIGGSTVRAAVDGTPSPGGWDRVESELALFAAAHLQHLVAVHAAAFVLDGRCVVVPGPSGAGKSTLCVAAARAGATVLTDEYVLVDPSSGLVTGWHRPVRMRRATGGADRLALVAEHGPVPVSLVALLVHRPGGGTDWRTIPAAEAVVGLLANTVCAQLRPDDSFDAALALARHSHAVDGVRGDASEAVARLRELVAATQ